MLLADWPDLYETSHVTPSQNDDVAFIVSIEDYAYAPDIKGARANALAWENFFRNDLQISQIVMLLDENATKEEILYQARELRNKTNSNSNVWMIFIGHGAPSPTGNHGVLVGVDAQQTARGLDSRSIPIPELISILEGSPSQQQIAIIDACFSGLSNNGETLAVGLQPFIAIKDLEPSRIHVITAAKGNQFAGSLPSGNRPAFSYVMLGALRGWGDKNEDKQVTLSEALNYSQQFLQETIIGRTQTPQKILGNEDIVLTTNGSSKPPNVHQIIEQTRIDSELKKEFESTKKSNEEGRYKQQSPQKNRVRISKNDTKTKMKNQRPSFLFFTSRRMPSNIERIEYQKEFKRENVEFFQDDEGNYIARLTGDNKELFVGDLHSMYVQPYQGRFSNGSSAFSYTFLDPRFLQSNQRDFSLKDTVYTLSCGTQNINLQPVQISDEDFDSISWYQRAWQRYSYLLLRDDFGTYYYIDRARTPEKSSDLRLYIGSKGKMSYQPADDIILDSAGLIIKSRDNRLVIKEDIPKKIYWANTNEKIELMEVNLYESQETIYNELGVYPKKKYYTACDPYFTK